MNNLKKSYKNDEGKEEIVIANSEDNYEIKLAKNYHLANHTVKKESKLAKKFKGSLLGSEIGVKNEGFSSITGLGAVLAIAAALTLYFIWRF